MIQQRGVAIGSSASVQEVPVAAHDLQQLEEALTLAAAPRPAAPIRASPPDDSPALQQQAVHVEEPTAFPADEQPMGNHAMQQGAASPAGPADAPANGQSEGSTALQEVPASEAVSSGAACSKQQQDSTASWTRDDKRVEVEVEDKCAPAMASMTTVKLAEQPKSSLAGSPTTSTAFNEPANRLHKEEEPRGEVPGVSSQAMVVSSSPVEACNSPQGVKEAARPAVPATSIQAEAVTSSPVEDPSSPQSLKEGHSPATFHVSSMKGTSPAGAPTAGAADTPAGARSSITAGTKLPIPEAVAEGTDKAAEATIGLPPATTAASQHVPSTNLTMPAPTDSEAAKATTGVPPVVTSASMDFEAGEAGHVVKDLAAWSLQGRGSKTKPSAISSGAEPRTSAEGKAAPDSPSALGEADAEPITHAAEGFTDCRAAADSPEADVRAKAVPSILVAKTKGRATPNGPATESYEADTIAAKHAADSASTMPKNLAGSSSAQAKSKRQAAKSKAAAQTAAAAAASLIPPAQSDNKSSSAPTAAAGSANVDAAGSAVSNPAAADAAAHGSSGYSSKVDDSVAALKHAGNRLDTVHAPGSAIARPDHADATAPKSAVDLPAVDTAAAKLALDLPAVDPAAARPAVDPPAIDPAAARPAVSNPTATDASSSTASGGHAAAAAPRPAQTGTEPKPVNGSSAGSSEGEYEVVAGAEHLEQLKDPQKRRLSGGATSVVNL